MTSRPILTPGPDHPISISPNPRRVRVWAAEMLIADTANALTLSEAGYPPVHYIPRSDVDMNRLERTDHESYCPYKGDASYYSVVALGAAGANAGWTYEQPYAAVSPIAGHLAFYPSSVSVTEEEKENSKA